MSDKPLSKDDVVTLWLGTVIIFGALMFMILVVLGEIANKLSK